LWDVARLGDAVGVAQRLAAGQPVDGVGPDGRTPLWVALDGGHKDVVVGLLQAGADVERPGPGGITPLMDAVGTSALVVVDALLRRGAAVAAVDDRGATALQHALEKKPLRPDVVTRLLDAGAHPNHGVPKALGLALGMGAAGVAAQLLARGAHVEDPQWMVLAMDAGASEGLLKALVVAGGSLDVRDARGQGLVHHVVVRKGMPQRLEALHRAGANLEQRDPDGVTPLMVAGKLGLVLLARKLLELGAALDTRDHAGLTALDHARAAGQRATAGLLTVGLG